MKLQSVLNLDRTQQRPVILLDGLSALLDTGAYFPIWTADEEILSEELGATLVKKGVSFSGFGGNTTGNLYSLPILKVGDLIYLNMHIIASAMSDETFSLILSATMFRGLSYEINSGTHKFTITVPDNESNIRNLKIEDSNGRLYVLCNGFRKNEV